MARQFQRYRGRRAYRYDDDYGRERALQHIEEARRLSAELGGTDKDVKAYFFSLDHAALQQVLDDYERKHGKAARDYAGKTIPKWRSGKVHMGGQTAARLFALLPPRMPLATKYHLIENLWQHVGPSSKKRIRIGLDADIEKVVATARDHVEAIVTHYRIPDQLEKRFTWLSAGDAGVKQDLLNHLRKMECDLAIESSRMTVPTLMEHLKTDTMDHTHRIAHILRIGKHEIELLLDRNATGVTLEDFPIATVALNSRTAAPFNYWWLLIAAGVILWMFVRSHR